MDTTYVYNQLRIPGFVKAEISNFPSSPDSISVSIPDTIRVASNDVSSSIFGMPIDVGAIVIPTIATLIVFCLGVLLNWLENKWQKRKETKAFRNTVFIWCALIEKPVNDQILGLSKLAADIRDNITLQGVQYRFSKSMVDHLKIASVENVVKHFINRSRPLSIDKRAFHAYNMVSMIDYFRFAESEIIKQYEEYQRQSISLIQEWNPEMANIEDKINSKSSSSREQLILTGLISIYSKWRKESVDDTEVDIFKARDLLFLPLTTTCEAAKVIGQGFYIVDSIYKSAKNQLTVVYKWEMLKNGFAKLFEDYAQNEKRSKEALMSAVKYFQTETKPSIWS